MNHGSLFSGIGGFDLAAKWMGWNNIFQVEIDPWCQKLLKQHYPDAKKFTDIREFDGRQFTGQLDIISGGFPCQPYSAAGQRKGKEDSRHLWPEMLRIIQEVQPRWVVGENVRGLINWNGGLVFDEVQSDLESAGYEVQPFLLPAAGVNAPHQRERIWFIAHSKMSKCKQSRNSWQGRDGLTNFCTSKIITNAACKQYERKNKGRFQSLIFRGFENDSNTNSKGREKFNATTITERQGQRTGRDFDCWDEWTTEPPVCGMDDGVSNRVHRIKGLGNAVVPQVVYRIFQTIQKMQDEITF